MENKEALQKEAAFLFPKKINCAVCREEFPTKRVRSAKLRRLQPDFDLRPRFQDIDTLKYDVDSCPFCGYTAMSNYFGPLSKLQISQILEQICMTFTPPTEEEPETFGYGRAIARYEQALKCSQVKNAKTSEIAYTYLKRSWLYRSYAEESQMEKAMYEERSKTYYKEAYDGFQKAISSEEFPICGMDSLTMDYLLACMAFHFKEYSFASKSLSNILSSKTASRRIKDKALDLKEIIVAAIKKEAEQKQAG